MVEILVPNIWCGVWELLYENRCTTSLTFFCLKKIKKGKKGKQGKRLSSRSKCYCFSHFSASRIQKLFLSAKHGGWQYFSLFHGPSTLKSILSDLITKDESYYDNTKWNNFRTKGLHFIRLNVYNLISSDGICFILKKTNAAVIGTCESKFDCSVVISEMEANGYDLIRQDYSRKGGRIVCYVKAAL